MKPLFTVVIPVFNSSGTVARAIDSVLNQSFSDWELIIVDDGSTDDLGSVLANYSDARLAVIRQENKGRCAARNIGADMATGKYVAFLDSDDEATAEWLEVLASLAVDEPEVICCGSTWLNTHEQTKKIVLPEDHGEFYFNKVFLMRAGTYAIQRQRFEELGGFDEALTLSEHTELSMRVIQMCEQHDWRIACTADAVVIVHDGGESMTTNDSLIPETVDYILSKHQEMFKRDVKKQQTYLDIAARASARNGNLVAARSYCRRSLRLGLSLKRITKLAACYIPIVAGVVFASNSKPVQSIGKQIA